MTSVEDVLEALYAQHNEVYRIQLARFDIPNDHALGIKIPALRAMAKFLRKEDNRHELAKALWNQKEHEAKLLATMIADEHKMTTSDMDAWTNDLYSWDLCDQLCSNLYKKIPFRLEQANKYIRSEQEFVIRCGIVIMIQDVVHNKKLEEQNIEQFLKLGLALVCNKYTMVKKGLSWLYRQIGKSNKKNYWLCMEYLQKINEHTCPQAQWIYKDAMSELNKKFELNKIKD
ncbi:MAG: DNA alkylation repair protein [Chitinophagaceae bacterium]